MRLQRINSVHHFFRLFWCAVGVYRWVESEECGTPSATGAFCFGVHFTSSVGLGALGCLQNKISSALFYSRHSDLLSKLEHLRMGAGKPASFINNQSLVILK